MEKRVPPPIRPSLYESNFDPEYTQLEPRLTEEELVPFFLEGDYSKSH